LELIEPWLVKRPPGIPPPFETNASRAARALSEMAL
jgi:hypothetical protein